METASFLRHSRSLERHSSHGTSISGAANNLQFQHSRDGGPSPGSLGPRSPESVRLGALGKHARSNSYGANGEGMLGNAMQVKTSRRRMACQPRRVRNVKCDSMRPSCGFCVSAGSHCVYLDASADKGRYVHVPHPALRFRFRRGGERIFALSWLTD